MGPDRSDLELHSLHRGGLERVGVREQNIPTYSRLMTLQVAAYPVGYISNALSARREEGGKGWSRVPPMAAATPDGSNC